MLQKRLVGCEFLNKVISAPTKKNNGELYRISIQNNSCFIFKCFCMVYMYLYASMYCDNLNKLCSFAKERSAFFGIYMNSKVEPGACCQHSDQTRITCSAPNWYIVKFGGIAPRDQVQSPLTLNKEVFI